MTETIILLTISYALVSVISIFVLFKSNAPIFLRLILTASVTILIFLTYDGIQNLRGLPSDNGLPQKFYLHWAKVEEPNKITGEPGAVFLWLNPVDDNNFQIELPRSYMLQYTDELADMVKRAQKSISDGVSVAGEIEPTKDESNSERIKSALEDEDVDSKQLYLGQKYISFDFGRLSFGVAPAPLTPKKTN